MADILIHRCRLRIARRGGWSWGADPRRLLDAAMRGVPALVARRLGELWPAGDERRISAPLRLRISLRLDELLALGGDDGASAGPRGALEVGLAQRLEPVLEALVRQAAGGATLAPAASDPAPEMSEPAEPAPQTVWAGSVLAVLLGWQRQAGLLPETLLSFSPAGLLAWHASLFDEAPAPARPAPAATPSVLPALLELAAELATLPLPLPAGRVAALIRRIALAVAAADRLGLAPSDPLLAEALASQPAFALPADGAPDPNCSDATARPLPFIATPRGQPPLALPAGRAAAPLPRSASPPTAARIDLEVASALPFLLLGPLSRTGYLLTLRAVFEAAQRLDALPFFAVALARKVLEPPRRGWLRSAEALTAAAAFAGQVEAPADTGLAELAHGMASQLSPLDAVVANVLTAGHALGAPLLLQAAPGSDGTGWLLCEAEGLFPIAWAARIEPLFARLAALGGELLLVPEAAVADDLLDRLDDAGFRFVTDAAPARGRSWRALHLGALRAWSNERCGPAAPLLGAAARLGAAAGAGEALWRALVVDRPGLPVGGDAALERSLALAAALALGTLAWTLWHEREAVTPLLALERFADLGARVSFRPDRVQVHLPLGRRFMDLKRAGLLADVADVPWFGGRPLQFVQG